jgi:hypothetical protein
MNHIHPIYTNYSCDEFGNTYNQTRLLKQVLHHTGYLVISVVKNKQRKQYRVHRFIYECIKGDIPKDKVIDHIDDIKTNNIISNLQVLSRGCNTRKARLRKNWGKAGQDNARAKLNNNTALDLFKDLNKGLSNTELGIKYNLHPRYVSLIRHKKRWKKLWQEYETSTTSF